MTLAGLLFFALILDALMGEPDWIWSRVPHPAVLFGRAVGWCADRFNSGSARRLKGIATMTGLALGAVLIGLAIQKLPGAQVWQVVIAAILLAQRSLVQHVGAVGDAQNISLKAGRAEVAKIVGRDTTDMDSAAVCRAGIESAAENFSDGVVAPAFWFLIGGLPGMLLYKATNTADSMIGHRNEEFGEFGWAAARLDDVLNLVPAKLTAAFLALAAGRFPDIRRMRTDAGLHRSPNAGWPEAAMAQGLDIALAGPRSYDGLITDFPYVNSAGRKDARPSDINAAIGIIWRGWAIMLAICAIVAVV